jgi:cation transporter-like permease
MFDTKTILTVVVGVLAGIVLEKKFEVSKNIPGLSSL